MFENIETSAAIQEAFWSVDSARTKFNDAKNKLDLSDESQFFLDTITERRPPGFPILMSHFDARLASTSSTINALLHFHNEHADRTWEIALGTLCWDDGVTPLSIARVDLGRLYRKADKAFREYGINAVYTVEPEIRLAHGEENGPRLMFGVHASCWREDTDISYRDIAERLMESKRFPNSLGAESVVFSRREQTTKNVVGLGNYLDKMPACVKQVRPNGRGGFRLSHEHAKYSPKMMLRMVEVLSHIPLFDNHRGVGDGKIIRRRWKQEMGEWARTNHCGEPIDYHSAYVADGWQRIREEIDLPGKPCRIILPR